MKTSIMVNALAKVGEDVQQLIAENLTTIIAAMRDQMIEKAKEDPEAKTSFGISIGATIEPYAGNDAMVKTKIAWAVKATRQADSVISDHPELDFDNAQAKAGE
jgi:hypothetical protein